MQPSSYDIITILGPTASGKTALAVALADALGGEVISGDSRQVYRGMDLGTGKDLSEYERNGRKIPYHLIDIADAGQKYNVFEFQRDFLKAYQDLQHRHVPIVFCGGSGLYLESVLRGYRLLPVPENTALRQSLANKTLSELKTILASYKTLHNTTDIDTPKRAIRAIEIETYYHSQPTDVVSFPTIRSLNIGVKISREERRKRITQRLRQRLDAGMIEEVEHLLNEQHIPAEDLIYYGLEYKYLTLYVVGKLTYDEMFRQLEIAIHQFAKRQMTWFRGMERRGIDISWLDANNGIEQNVANILTLLRTDVDTKK